MKEQKSITVNFILNGLLNLSSIMFPVITFPYVSRILLPEGVGRVSFATSIVAYFVMLAQLGIPTYGIKTCAGVRDNKEALSRTVHELFLISFIMNLAAYLLFFAALAIVPRLGQDRLLFLIVSLNIVLRVINLDWLYKALEQYAYITIWTLIFQGAALIGIFLTVHSKEDYIYYGALTVAASSGSSILNFIHARQFVQIKRVGNYHIKRHIKAVFVFFAMSCAIMVYTNLDISMLGLMKSNTDVGYYNVAVKVKLVLVNVITTLGTVLLPRVSYYCEKGMQEEFYKTSKMAVRAVFMMALPLTVYFILFAEESIAVLSGDAFAGTIVPMQIIMLTLPVIGLTNVMGIQMLVPLGCEKCTLYSVISGAIADLFLNLILIPSYGAAGAAVGTLIAEIVVFIVQYIYILKYTKDLYKKFYCGRVLFACFVAGAFSLFAKMLPLSDIIILIISFLIFIGIYIGVLIWQREEFVISVICKFRNFFRIKNKNEDNDVKAVKDSKVKRSKSYIYRSEGKMGKKNYYLKNIFDDFIKNWKIITVIAIVLMVILGGIGYSRAFVMGHLSKEQQEEIDAYNEQLETYDKQIEEMEINLANAEEEAAKVQEYIDNSLYMKLDGQNLQVATVQYAVVDTANAYNILYALATYINTGGLQEDIAKEYGDTEAGYLKETISCAITANLLDITVIHYDKEEASKALKLICESVENYVPGVTEVHGAFNWKKTDISEYSKVDMNVTNTQNARVDSLNSYMSAQANYSGTKASYISSKDTYIEDNTPEVMEASAPGPKLIVIYAIFGILLGIVLPFVVFSLRYLLSDHIRSEKELKNSGINVLASYSSGDAYKNELERSVMDIEFLMKRYQTDGVFIDAIYDADDIKKASDDITSALKEKDIAVSTGYAVGEDASELKEMIDKKYCIIAVKAGKNTYPQLAKQMDICRKFDVAVCGCILVK